MKIAFVVAGVYPVYTWKEIQKSYPTAVDKETFDFIKVLEQNKEFEREVIATRKKVGIPKEGYSFDQYKDLLFPKSSMFPSNEYSSKFQDLLKRSTKESLYLFSVFDIPQKVIEHIPYIVMANIVHHIPQSIELKRSYFARDGKDMVLRFPEIIISNKISKQELLNWIQENWKDEIKPAIEHLQLKPSFRISKRDLDILKLKDEEGLTYSEIADKLSQELDDSEGKINENSVKQACKRAREVINSLKK